MPEDSQPNDLRGRRALESTIPPILSAHPIPLHRGHLSHPSLPKRSSSPSYASTPAKRRRLTSRRIEPSQKDVRREIIRPLPLSCRKGVSHCHSNRKQFIANEIKSLQKSEPGLRVQAHSVTYDAVLFSCVQSDILNCSLAPNLEPANKLPEKSRSQPKVDPPVVAVPIISGVSGPIRVFKSGTISFQPPVPVAETGVEGGLVSRKPDLFKTDTKRVPPAAIVRTPAPPLEPKESLRSITSSSVYLESGATSRELTRSDKQAMLALEPLPSTSSPASSLGTIAIPDTSQKPVIKMASTLRFSSYIYEPDGDEFQLPSRQQYDKLRRFLCGPSASSSVVVSMYGAVDGVDVAARRHWLVSQGSNPTKAAVDDACLVTDGGRSFAVLAHGRDNEQLSFVNISRDGGTIPVLELKRPWNPAKKGGASAVAAMMQPLMFASGGYDHCVHLWKIEADFSAAAPQVLAGIKHNSQVQSLLAIRDTSHKLVTAGADCSVHIWDLSSERVVHMIKTSNSVYHAHTTTSPFCTLLEVAHRELQFEVRDHRLVPTITVQRFGYTSLQVHGRFMKGASLSNCFASGDRGGRVRLWDLRNVKAAPVDVECFSGQKIAHIVFQGPRLLACSENNHIRLVKYEQPI